MSVCKHNVDNQLTDSGNLERAYFGHELKPMHITVPMLKICCRRQLVTALKFKIYGCWSVNRGASEYRTDATPPILLRRISNICTGTVWTVVMLIHQKVNWMSVLIKNSSTYFFFRSKYSIDHDHQTILWKNYSL